MGKQTSLLSVFDRAVRSPHGTLVSQSKPNCRGLAPFAAWRQARALLRNGEAGCALDRTDELVEFRCLVEKALGALGQVALAEGGPGVDGEHDELDARLLLSHGAQHLKPGTTVQLDIEYHNIRTGGQDPVDAVLRRLPVPDDLHLSRSEHRSNALAHQRRVLGEENF